MSMAKPQRLQLSRARGFNLQEASRALNGLPCRVIARPTRYGNPFAVRRSKRGDGWDVWRGASLIDGGFPSKEAAARNAVKRYRRLLETDGVRRKAVRELRGFNVACYCPLDQPCHGDPILELANG